MMGRHSKTRKEKRAEQRLRFRTRRRNRVDLLPELGLSRRKAARLARHRHFRRVFRGSGTGNTAGVVSHRPDRSILRRRVPARKR